MTSACPFSLPHPLDHAYVHDPYPFLAKARDESPVSRIEELDVWVVTRYQDIKEILHDPDTYSNANAQQPMYPICEQARKVFADRGFTPGASLTASDPPIHSRLRKHYSQVISFTPSRTEALRPWLQRQISTLIDAFADRGRADLVGELTTLLPARVIFHLIGFPKEDGKTLVGWCEARLQLTGGRLTAEQQVAVAERMSSYWHYCEEFVTSKAQKPADDYTSELLRIHDADPDALSIKEITTLIYALTFAGQETTNNFMGSMLLQLLRKRERWEALIDDPALVPAAVEECLRLEPSIPAWRRVTTRDTEISGVKIPKGGDLLLHLGSSGHDSEIFPQGEEIDLTTATPAPHLTFGHGIHFCLGAGLARAESGLVLETLQARFPALRLVPEQRFEYEPNLLFRGPKRLLVEW